MEGTILVVDDDPGARDLLERLLGEQGHVVMTARDGAEAIALIPEIRPDLIMLDVGIPVVDGSALVRRLRGGVLTNPLPVLLMTASTASGDLRRGTGADGVLRKPFNRDEVLSWTQCLVHARQVVENLERTEAALVSVAAAIEARSAYEADHIRRVANLSTRLAATVGLGDETTAIIRKAGLFHDVGMVGVPDAILRKPAPLTQDEFEQVKRHTLLGADLCHFLPHGREVSAIVRAHHERWDGKGYPSGLAGGAIPLGARIVSIADAFDAYTSDRPYRSAMSADEAWEILWAGAGTQWDPGLIERFEHIGRQNP